MRKSTGADPRKRKGLIIVNTGEGKGKSTAAFGLALRAAGNKMNVFIMQFMKGQWKAGERKSFEKLAPYVEVIPMGDGFTWDTENIEQDKATARKAFEIVNKPQITEVGADLTFMFKPGVAMGSQMTIESAAVPQVNGEFYVYMLTYTLANRDTPWYLEAMASKVAI